MLCEFFTLLKQAYYLYLIPSITLLFCTILSACISVIITPRFTLFVTRLQVSLLTEAYTVA